MNHLRVSTETRAVIVDILNELPSNNIFLNTAIVEALNAFNAIEPPCNADHVVREIKEILAMPKNPEARLRAYDVVSRQFEEIFSSTVMEALGQLAAKDRTSLYAMAALGAPSSAHDGGWYVRELIQAEDSRDNELVVEALAHWARPPRGDEPDLQGRIGGFIGAHVAQARLGFAHVSAAAPQSADDESWQCWGTLIRHAASAELVANPAALRVVWDRLQHFSVRAVPQLVWIDQQIDMWRIGGSRSLLRDAYPAEVKRLLESGLANRPLHSLVRHSAFVTHDERGAIVLLGAVGDGTSRRLLTKLMDVPEIGDAAVAAIRAIDARL